MDEPGDRPGEKTLVAEAQLILAEKRTSLATLRTGIAVLALPLSLLGLLVVFSKHYALTDVALMLVPLLVLSVALGGVGVWLLARSIRRIRHQDRMLLALKREHPRLSRLLDV